ncbi:hypothetical protein D187_003788 [Cystobacter fuscus DSM 2262]|uniref:Uncharacterized protein n=1 Tax=Cystobacter fuscus (strain ATCC 25194 / DSM 2262 / NBRC 100088 / M29) TaxID=1242864 RepID=S9P2C6_CYSF2|nr:hypothetical protein D187_003788 [Cystobacter fuscus DSM 2262]
MARGVATVGRHGGAHLTRPVPAPPAWRRPPPSPLDAPRHGTGTPEWTNQAMTPRA